MDDQVEAARAQVVYDCLGYSTKHFLGMHSTRSSNTKQAPPASVGAGGEGWVLMAEIWLAAAFRSRDPAICNSDLTVQDPMRTTLSSSLRTSNIAISQGELEESGKLEQHA